jgi:predicted transposase/invertase (TIGR01784 family)
MFRYLDPKSDFAFHKLFGQEKNKDILLSFLNAVFEGVHDTIEDVEYIPPALYPDTNVIRQSIVDVLCRDSKGRRFIIEMQCAKDDYFIRRSIAYASAVYISQRDKSKGGGYKYMEPVIFLGILDFNLFPNKKSYISHHMITDVATGEHDLNIFSFSYIELPKFNKAIDELETVIDKWSYFFKNAVISNPNMIDRIKGEIPVLDKAFDILLAAASSGPEFLESMRFEMKEDEINNRIEAGKKEEKVSVALSMLQDGMPIDAVSKYTGLAAEEIEQAIRAKDDLEKGGKQVI